MESVMIFLLSFLKLVICVLFFFFFFIQPDQRLINFIDLSKGRGFGFVDFLSSTDCLFLTSLISALIFIISFAYFGFNLPHFFSFPEVEAQMIDFKSSVLIYTLSYKFPSKHCFCYFLVFSEEFPVYVGVYVWGRGLVSYTSKQFLYTSEVSENSTKL